MATQPTNPIIKIAGDDVNLPSTGQPNKNEPTAGIQTTGYDNDQVVTAEELNYIFDNFSDWLEYLVLEDSDTSTRIDGVDSRIDELEDNTVTGGDGLTGGGDLSQDRVIEMGTPSSLDGTTSNNVTATSHTHELNMASQAEAEGGVEDTKLMTSLRTRENVVSSFTQNFNSTKGSCTLPNGLILNWGTLTLGAEATWLEADLDTPYTTTHLSITLGINGVVGGANDNSNVSIRPHPTTPLTKLEYQQRGQSGTVTYMSLGF